MTGDRNHVGGNILLFKYTFIFSSSPSNKQMRVRVIYLKFLLAGMIAANML